MRTELNYFHIGDAEGGSQDWFTDPMMKLGGCAAVCACDTCIYLTRMRWLTGVYPFDAEQLTKDDFVEFSKIMKPYLRPRWAGVNKTEIYVDGLGRYLRDCGEKRIAMESLSGERPVEEAQAALIRQIDAGLPVPCLILNHGNKAFSDYEWHWFMLTGYDTDAEDCLVKAVTYGAGTWLSLAGLWDTGRTPRGGLVLYQTVSI